MSDELTKKLDNLLDSFAERYHPEHEYNKMWLKENEQERKEAIEQIQQAFGEDGWKHTGTVTIHKNWEYISHKKLSTMMTGQEWYDAFAREWSRSVEGRYFDGDSFVKAAQEAARRAAGLEGDRE